MCCMLIGVTSPMLCGALGEDCWEENARTGFNIVSPPVAQVVVPRLSWRATKILMHMMLQEQGGWQEVLRALCALEAVVQQGASASCGECAVRFQSDPSCIQAACKSPQVHPHLALSSIHRSNQSAGGRSQWLESGLEFMHKNLLTFGESMLPALVSNVCTSCLLCKASAGVRAPCFVRCLQQLQLLLRISAPASTCQHTLAS